MRIFTHPRDGPTFVYLIWGRASFARIDHTQVRVEMQSNHKLIALKKLSEGALSYSFREKIRVVKLRRGGYGGCLLTQRRACQLPDRIFSEEFDNP